MAASPSSSPSRLDIGDAIQSGWNAFSRSPWAFVLFTLLMLAVQLVAQPLQERIGNGTVPSPNPLDWLLALIGLVISVAGSIWASVGLVRGAWQALDGGKPTFAQLLRWDGPAVGRVFRSWLLLSVVIGVPLIAALLVGGGPLLLLAAQSAASPQADWLQVLMIVFTLVLAVALGLVLVWIFYLSISQKFLFQIAVVEEQGPVANLKRGRQLVDSQWPMVMILQLIEGLVMLIGALACFVGLFVAWPLAVCISTAAYRQLVDMQTAAALGDS
jgi:hypothetical protein